MTRLPKVKQNALRLRRKGYSIKEIAGKLKIAVGTSSLWLRHVTLNRKAQERLVKRRLIGYYKSGLRWINKNKEIEKKNRIIARNILRKVSKNRNHTKVYCALLYWCEGNKSGKNNQVKFTNSDPFLVKTFITLFRKSFTLDESKFRALVHIHNYHNDQEIKKFWSHVTNIPLRLFHKSYLKPNTKKRIRENYKGCITISYFDYRVSKELSSIYKVFAEKWGRSSNW